MPEGGELRSTMPEGGELRSTMPEGKETLVLLMITLFRHCKYYISNNRNTANIFKHTVNSR